MKKILLLGYCLFSVLSSMGQDFKLEGKVTSSENGEALPGVSVLVKGTTVGTVTDADGNFSLLVPSSSTHIVFSFIGYRTQESVIAGSSTFEVALVLDATQLSEVVVTALGIERKRNELPYAAQEVKGEDITRTRNPNFVNTLSGKVAGLDIKTNNNMGGSTNVVIRGYKSITGNNQALFVIDGVPVSNANLNTAGQQAGGVGVDFGNAASDINPDNIESVTVLKGAAATALYGSRAANGVIMITTKKGTKNSFDVSINTGVTFGQIDKSTFARYQKEYGAGYGKVTKASIASPDGWFTYYDVLGNGVKERVVQFGEDASYGPAFDPNLLVYQWGAFDPFSPTYLQTTPWVAAENDPSTFFETSVNSNQSISISGGKEASRYSFTYTRSDEKGILPNSSLKKDMFNFSNSFELNSKLTVSTSVNYTKVKGVGRYGTGYNGENPNQQFRQWWQTNVDIAQMKTAFFRNRQNVSWNLTEYNDVTPLYSDNPYWTRYKNFANDSRDNYMGFASVNYKVASWLDVTGRVSYNGTNDLQEQRVAVGSSGTSGYSKMNREFNETNYDLMLNFRKDISEDFSFRGLLGSNMRRTLTSSMLAATNGGLVVPDLYSLSNSSNPITPPIETLTRIGVDGVFASATFGYKEFLFVEAVGRQDKSTTLPKGNNTYFYPSLAGNFVFSNVIKSSFLSHGNLRVNYAEVGNDAPAASLTNVYDNTQFGNRPLFSMPTTKNNNELKSERTKNIEAGLQVELLKGRAGVDFTVYKMNTLDQVLPVSVSNATGFLSMFVNSGEVENKGMEVELFAVPVRSENFTWRISANFSKNRNKVVSLYGEGDNKVTNVPISISQGGITLNAAVGHPFGVIKGTNFVYTNGQKTVDAQGYYIPTASSAEIIGDPNPDWLGGVANTFTYKNLSLNFLIDVRHGGDIFSLDQWYGEGTGLYPETAGLNELGNPRRALVAEGGGVLLPGVTADGSPNTKRVEAYDGNVTPFGYARSTPRAGYVYDGSYVKLREVGLTFSLPESWTEKLKLFKAVDVSLVGRNLWIIHKNMKYSDPEESVSSGNANRGYQTGAYAAVKTYGFNVKLNF